MNKTEILKKYAKQDDKLLVANVLDKVERRNKINKIVNTNFLDEYQIKLVDMQLKNLNIQNYEFFGGKEENERKILFIYPDKLQEINRLDMYKKVLSVIRIELPNENKGKYHHKDFLGAILKLGIKRELIGDIIVHEDGADIIILSDILKYVLDNIQELKRFSKSKISVIEIDEIKEAIINKIETSIRVSSLRLDSIISEILNISRSKASQIIEDERAFVNFENILRKDKNIKEGDLLTIRGKGRFEIKEIRESTKNENYTIYVDKWN